MPTLPVLGTFLPVSLLIAIVPGPSWLLVLNATAEAKRRGGLAAIVGNSAGILSHTVAAAAGLSALIYLSPSLLDGVRFLGAAYLIYLGQRALRSSTLVQVDREADQIRTPRRIMQDGLIVNLLNPKMIVLMFSLLPQFISDERGTASTQILVLGVLHTCSSLLILVPLCFSTSSMLSLLSRNRVAQLTFRVITAALLAGFGIHLGLTDL